MIKDKIYYIAVFIIIIFIMSFFINCEKEIMTPSGGVVKLVISPSTVSLKKNGTYKFSVLAYDKNNNYVNITPIWSVESNYGVINNKGYFYVKNDVQPPFPKKEYVIAKYNGLQAVAEIIIKLSDFWIFSDIYAQDFMYDYPDPRPDFGGKLGTWGACELSTEIENIPPGGGNKSLKIRYTNSSGGGCYWLFCDASWHTNSSYAEDFSCYSNNNSYLDFWVKATNDILIKIEAYDGTSDAKNLSSYVTLKNEWQEVSIPLTDFSGVTFSKIKTLLGFHLVDGTTGTVYVDEIRFKSNSD